LHVARDRLSIAPVDRDALHEQSVCGEARILPI
jgi:hypothetical protein